MPCLVWVWYVNMRAAPSKPVSVIAAPERCTLHRLRVPQCALGQINVWEQSCVSLTLLCCVVGRTYLEERGIICVFGVSVDQAILFSMWQMLSNRFMFIRTWIMTWENAPVLRFALNRSTVQPKLGECDMENIDLNKVHYGSPSKLCWKRTRRDFQG